MWAEYSGCFLYPRALVQLYILDVDFNTSWLLYVCSYSVYLTSYREILILSVACALTVFICDYEQASCPETDSCVNISDVCEGTVDCPTIYNSFCGENINYPIINTII